MKTLIAPKRITNNGDAYGLALNSIILWAEKVTSLMNNLITNTPDDSTASDVPGIVSDFNDLLAVLRGLSTK